MRLGSWALFGLALALGGLRLTHNDIWYDEAASLHFARQGGLHFFRGLIREDSHGPLYYGLLKLWTLAFGESPLAARLPSVLCAAGAVAITARLGAQVLGPAVGLLAGLFLALSPLHLCYAQEVRFYSFVELLVVLQMLCFLSLMGPRAQPADASPPPPRWPWWGLVGAGAASLLTFYVSSLIVLAELTCAACLWRRIERKRVLSAFAAMAGLFALWLPACQWQLRHTTASIDWIKDQRTWNFLRDVGLALTSGKGATWFDLVVALGLAVSAGIVLVRRVRSRQAGGLVLACWLGVPLVLLLVISTMKPLYHPRYLLFVAPAFFLLAAAGVARARPAWARWPLRLAVLAGLVTADVRYYAHFKQTDRWREAAAFVRSEAMRTDVLVAVPAHDSCLLTYYFPDFRRLRGAYQPFQVDHAFARGSRLWLFTHRGQDQIVPAQLATDALLLESRDFGTLNVASLFPRR